MTTAKAEILANLPEAHAGNCRRALPYSSPLWRSLDLECPRCQGLIALLDEARDRRIAATEELKRRIVSKLDGLPHKARGYKRQDLAELAEGPGRNYRVLKALRELQEDRLIQEIAVSGVQRYVLYGR